MSVFVGIDLGTTFSAAARIDEHGRAVIVPNSLGRPITPSVIAFDCGTPVFGQEAKNRQKAGATDVASFFKRSMGDANFALEFGGRRYTPTDLSALLLAHLKAEAECSLGDKIEQAVITVPAYFNNAQRQATLDAGARAGLQVLCIINEPTAAALAYGVRQSDRTERVLVYDLGGGTFDASLVSFTPDRVEVLATDGNHDLGGKDWDDALAQHLDVCFRKEYGVSPLEETLSCNELLVRVEEAKKELSERSAVTVTIDHAGRRGSYKVTREEFERLTESLVQRTGQLTESMLAAVNVGWPQVDAVLLVGGSTRLPMIKRYVERLAGKPAREGGVNVDEAVALGAAIQAGLDMRATGRSRGRLAGARRAVGDVMSHSLGMIAEAPDRSRYLNSIIVPKNRPIPCVEKRPYQLRTRSSGANNLEVYMTQGESIEPRSCSMLGRYQFTGITHVPGNDMAVLDISYAYDRNGVVAVTATERSTGKALAMSIEPLPDDMSWLQKPPKEAARPAHVTVYLAFDLSGSMAGHPLVESQKAARAFLERMDLAHSSIGLISFADTVRVDCPATQDGRAIHRAIGKLAIGRVGGGNQASPFAGALRELRRAQDPRCLIVLTDGMWDDQPGAVREAKECHAENVEVIAVGFGGTDEQFLREVSNSDSAGFLKRLDELVETFSNIAQELTEKSGVLRRKG